MSGGVDMAVWAEVRAAGMRHVVGHLQQHFCTITTAQYGYEHDTIQPERPQLLAIERRVGEGSHARTLDAETPAFPVEL